MKLAVITDTSAAISEAFKRYDNLHVLEIPIEIDGQDISSKTLADEDFFALMADAKDVPKTAQPRVADLEELLTRLKAQGYTHVLGLFLTSGISGFYQNAFYLQDAFAPMVVKFPETNITSSPLGNMVETALTLAQNGSDWADVLGAFDKQEKGDIAYMLVDDLKWLSKSGRLSNGAAILGTLLNIKPVLTFSAGGKVEVYEKVRTEKKSLARMKELLLRDMKKADRLYIIHADNLTKAQELYDYAVAEGYEQVEIVTFGPVIATHLGLGAVAYASSPRIGE